MGQFTLPTVLLVAATVLQALASNVDTSNLNGKDDYEPMVAFMCNKPAMHRTPEGWKRDDKTSCFTEPLDILEYCKSMYPNHDITNVVEANYQVTIKHWCKFGHKHCHAHGTHTVSPFRCLVGAFQSTALLVPEHCLFDHYHDTNECQSDRWWNQTAEQKCTERGMKKQSFDILLPCGIERFSGIEFVCCPNTKKPAVHIEVEVEQPQDTPDSSYSDESDDESDDEDESDESDEDEDEEASDESASSAVDDQDDNSTESDDESSDDNDDDESDESDSASEEEESPRIVDLATEIKANEDHNGAYVLYLKNRVIAQTDTEHDRYATARKDWQMHHHEKISNMMKQWASARERVAEVKKTDTKTADKLNKEITERFQRMYHALEKEGDAEKIQLSTLHQQHVQKMLNEKKRLSMQHYMEELQKDMPQTAKVLKTLEHYIRIEEKDRRHTINRYEHLLDINPDEAVRIRSQIVDHLGWIDKRVSQSIKMLSRLPSLEKKIKPEIKKFLIRFHGLDTSANKILNEEPFQSLDETIPVTDSVEIKVGESASPVKEVESQLEDKNLTEEKEDKDENEDMNLSHPYYDSDSEAIKDPKFDPETMEDESTYFDVKPHFVAHQMNDETHADRSIVHRLTAGESSTYGATFGIAMGSVAVFVIIVVAVVMLRKRSRTPHISHGFVEVDPAASPEEKHVANMQMNGYENPTYKYFELGQ